jgi:hypothetical protein
VRLPLKGGPIQTIDTTETREGPPLTVRVVSPGTATRIASYLSDIPRVYVTDEAEALKLAIVDFRIRNPHLGEAPWRSISEKLNDAKLAGELGFEPRLTESESSVAC